MYESHDRKFEEITAMLLALTQEVRTLTPSAAPRGSEPH